FVFIVWKSGKYTCYRKSGNFKPNGAMSLLLNGGESRVWLYQHPNGHGGWGDCFFPGEAWEMQGRDQRPAGLRVTNPEGANATQCSLDHPPNVSNEFCGPNRGGGGLISLWVAGISTGPHAKGPACWDWTANVGKVIHIHRSFTLFVTITQRRTYFT